MSVRPDTKSKPYSGAAIEAFRTAFGTALTAIAILETMDPLDKCMIAFQRLGLKLMEEFQKSSPDREKIDFLLDAVRRINQDDEAN